MKKHTFLICALAASLTSCSSHSSQQSDTAAAQARSANSVQVWEQALRDSITCIQARYDESVVRSDSAKAMLKDLLQRFEIIQDPLLVEPYRVAKGWGKHDTTGKQGILARALEDGSIEIVVTAATEFSSITLSAGADKIQSQSVPAGNALHTSANGLTRVAFNNAEPLARFVHDHIGATITLGCGASKVFTLNEVQKRMIADTYNFVHFQSEVHELDREQSVLYNKLLLCNTKLDELKQQEEQ